MWLDAYSQSRYDRAPRSMGTRRAALGFVATMIKDIGDEALPDDASKNELIHRRRKAMNGGKDSSFTSLQRGRR
jgi:hypothetical protein